MYDRRNDYLRRRRDRRSRDYSRDYNRDYNYRDRERYNRDRERDRREYYDYRSYPMNDEDQEYRHDLEEWSKKLRGKDRFNISREHLIQQAKNMGVRFEEFSEDEFFAIYLMHVSDYPSLFNEYNMYIRMTKDWLEDDDLPISPSEKVCKYLYNIVLGED